MIEQDPADRAYNKLISPNGPGITVLYAELRNGDIVQLNPLGPCFGGQIFPLDTKRAPMELNVVSAWLDDNKKVVWRRPPKPPQSKPKSVLPPPPPSKKSVSAPPSTKSVPAPPPPPPRKGVSEDHIIYTKITEGKVTTEDFNKLIQEATPESVRDRVRRRMKTNATDSHQDEDGHQQLDLPDLNKRVQPKRKPSNRSQMHGRGRVAHRHSSRTQAKTMPKRFAEAIEFIREYIGKPDYDNALQLVEDKHSLNVVATKLMAVPNIDRDWLSELTVKCS